MTWPHKTRKRPTCAHHTPDRLGYLAATDPDAARRIERGVEQAQCPTCKRYFWPHEMGEVAP